MKNLSFKFYSELKNEDAMPYVGGNILVVADGLGGSGSSKHEIDRDVHSDMRGDILSSAFGDMPQLSQELAQYIEELLVPMADGEDDTSALWASRIVIARCVYALTEGEFKDADLSDEKVRARLSEFITEGLHTIAEKFHLEKGKYDGQLLLPTTLAFIRYTETKRTVIAETVWAGDSRCYALTPDGLKLLSVDDEDDSGSITNLFYADNKKCKLNYVRHEISKPCAFMAVSDGVFDPFTPSEHLGVEHTLLSSIRECGSAEELSKALKTFFDDVHGDDATMAFAAFGFSNYADMQRKLAKRTDKILTIRRQQAEMHDALEVLNQTEEEIVHYVLTRTGDRYDYLLPMLIETIESGASDIAITPAMTEIAEDVKKAFGAEIERAKERHREQAFARLYDYVKEHPELVVSEILTKAGVDFRGNLDLKTAFANMQRYAVGYVVAVNTEDAERLAQLDAQGERLHCELMEKITFYRDLFDRLGEDPNSDYRLRQQFHRILCIWENIDCALQYKWRVAEIGSLPKNDNALAYKVRDYVEKYKKVSGQIKEKQELADTAYRRFVQAWDVIFDYVKNSPTAMFVLLSPETVRQFGLDVSDDSMTAEFGKGTRDGILRALKGRKADVVPDIVKAFAENFDKTSVIDGQYNATKLELFRTYYRLRATPDNGVKALEKQLTALEAEYTSLVEA